MMRLIAVMAACAMLGGCGDKAAAGVEGAWLRLPAVPGRPGAAYFHLRAGDRPQTLVAVSTPAAIRAELHESMGGSGGMMSMTPLRQVAVPAGGSIDFAPGGRHVMLFDVSPALKPGATAKLVLKFADGKAIETQAKVVGPGGSAPDAP